MKFLKTVEAAKERHAFLIMRDLLSNTADEIQKARMLAEDETKHADLGMNSKMAKEFSDELGKAATILLKQLQRFE